MDKNFASGGIPPLLCTQVLLVERNRAEDFTFIKRSLLEKICSDFHDFNESEARTAG